MKIWRNPSYRLSRSIFRRQSLHDDDIYRLSSALGPVEEPPAAKDNHSPSFKSVIYLANINAQLLHKRDAYEGIRFLKATRLFLSPERFAVPG